VRIAALLLLALAGCPHAPRGTTPAPSAKARWSPAPGLVDVACSAEGVCEGQDASGRWSFRADAPAARSPVSAGAPSLLLPPAPSAARETPDELDQDGQAAMFASQLSDAVRASARVGFYRLVVSPGDARVALLPGNGSTLMRTGGGIKAVRLGIPEAQQPWPAALALHPTGRELYVLAWPDGVLRALDPATLAPRWTLPLENPAYGLYIDGSGRYLVGQVMDMELVLPGDVAQPAAALDRLAPWPEPDGDCTDEALRDQDAPPATGTFVVDLATRSVAAALPGRLRRTLAVPGPGLLVATSEALQYIATSPAPSSNAATDPLTPEASP